VCLEADSSGTTRKEITMTIGRITRIAFLVFSAVLLFAFVGSSGSEPANSPTSQLTQPALAAQAVESDPACSVSSLRGTYAVQAQGTIVGQLPGFPPPPFPIDEAALVSFDGAGNLSGKTTLNIGGVVLQPTFTGTYTVNSDCTGNTTVHSSLGFVVHDATILVRGGREFRDVQTDSFEVSTRNGVRIED
jgi:hypothetical protein